MNDDRAIEDPLIGKTVHGYRIDAFVSRSAGTTVYRATQLSVARPVALKVLNPGLAGDAAEVERFLSQVRAAGRVTHKSIVEVHEIVREDEGLTFYSMEWCDGGSLRDVLERRGASSCPDVVRWLGGCLQGLLEAEKAGLFHANLRPEHVLFSKGGEVKLLHLGLPGPDASAARVEDLVYLAPEQIARRQVDGLTGLYALGATFAEAISGRAPFAARSLQALKVEKASRPTPDIRHAAGAPRWFIAFLQRSTAPDREKRFASLRSAAASLSRKLAEVAAAAEEAEVASREKGRVRPRVRGVRLAGFGVALVLGAALLVGLWRLLDTPALDGNREEVSHSPAPATEAGPQPAPPTARPRAPAPPEEAAGRAERERDRAWASVESAVLGGDLRTATEDLRKLAESFPEERQRASERLRELVEVARGQLIDERPQRERASAAGEFDRALELLENSAKLLPDEVAAEVAEERQRIEAARADARVRAERFTEELELVLAEAISLEFSKALERLGALSREGRGGEDRGAGELTGLRDELTSLQDLWKEIAASGFAWAESLPEKVDRDALAAVSPARRLGALRRQILAGALSLHAGAVARKRSRDLFKASSVALGGDVLTLAYELGDSSELQDFVRTEGSLLELDGRGSLRLRGECRLLRGDPFRDSLRVEIVLGGPTRHPVNLAVALWTEGSDRVSFDPAAGSRDTGDDRFDYFVCGLAYEPRDALASSLTFPASEYPVLVPCDVILPGTHGQPLHAAHGWRCLWGRSLLESPGRRRQVVIEDTGKVFRWETDGKPVAEDLPAAAIEALKRGPRDGRRGSVSFLTSGADLVLERLEISGRVSDEWLTERARSLAKRELEEKLPDVDWEGE